jgi:hypothetical protein
MCQSGLASLVIFFCDFREDQKKVFRGLLSSVIVQLCRQSDSYGAILSDFYNKHENGSQDPSEGELIRCVQNLLELPRQAPVYLIIDALDECQNTSAMLSPREKALAFVIQLMESEGSNMRICISSRPR